MRTHQYCTSACAGTIVAEDAVAKGYATLHQFDVETGIEPRSDDELAVDAASDILCRPAAPGQGCWDEYLAALGSDDVAAIVVARGVWGLPIFS